MLDSFVGEKGRGEGLTGLEVVLILSKPELNTDFVLEVVTALCSPHIAHLYSFDSILFIVSVNLFHAPYGPYTPFLAPSPSHLCNSLLPIFSSSFTIIRCCDSK